MPDVCSTVLEEESELSASFPVLEQAGDEHHVRNFGRRPNSQILFALPDPERVDRSSDGKIFVDGVPRS